MAIVNRRMKVMHIISGDLWAGAEVQAYTLLKELRTECDLHVILMNPGELADRLVALEIPVTILDETRMNAGKILLGMRKIMFSFRPDIIHTHRQKENILGAIANLLSVRAKSVRTSHGAPEIISRGIKQLQVHIDRFVGRYFQNAIVAVSSDLAQKLALHYPNEKIHIINNGIDIEALRRSKAAADFRLAAPDAIHIGIIGRLEPVKRVDIFLAMAAQLKDTSSYDFRFHVIGDGRLKSELEAAAHKLGVEAATIFHGHRRDMAACIGSLDFVVMCSDHEGTPMTALEALALGTPLIAHKIGGLTDVLENYPGFLVSDHSPEGYAAVIGKCLDHSLRQQFELPMRYKSEKNRDSTKSLYQMLLK